MDDAERRAQIERYLEYSGIDQHISHQIYHDDAVLEFPQSGERFEGVENFQEWRRRYPTDVELELRELRGEGDLRVAELSVRYNGGPPQLERDRRGPRNSGACVEPVPSRH